VPGALHALTAVTPSSIIPARSTHRSGQAASRWTTSARAAGRALDELEIQERRVLRASRSGGMGGVSGYGAKQHRSTSSASFSRCTGRPRSVRAKDLATSERRLRTALRGLEDRPRRVRRERWFTPLPDVAAPRRQRASSTIFGGCPRGHDGRCWRGRSGVFDFPCRTTHRHRAADTRGLLAAE